MLVLAGAGCRSPLHSLLYAAAFNSTLHCEAYGLGAVGFTLPS